MATRFHCRNPRRLEALRHGMLNGIEYLEVLDQEAPDGRPEPWSDHVLDAARMRQRTLMVRFVWDIPDSIDQAIVVLEGGIRLTNLRIQWAYRADAIPAPAGSPDAYVLGAERDLFEKWAGGSPSRTLVVRLAQWGDFDTYRLSIRFANDAAAVAAGFDPRSLGIDFSFKVECPSPLDCRVASPPPMPSVASPNIDYTEKDYEGFRRIMLDRIAQVSPRWVDRNPGDLGITLVELLAYAADHLSYYQDAVATEAYLGTARQRISLRRHARMLDYFIHEGLNARAWVTLDVSQEVEVHPGDRFWTRVPGLPAALDPADQDEARRRAGSIQVFEAIDHLRAVPAHNEIHLHTWEGLEGECCLPAGATEASLVDQGLQLAVGDVLVLEEVHPRADALEPDVERRHAVRLTKVGKTKDFVFDVDVLEVAWHVEDALPFSLSLERIEVDGVSVPVTVARGNTVLVDHGETLPLRPLGRVPDRGAKRYRPVLEGTPLTFRRQLASASGALPTPYDLSRGATEAILPRGAVSLPAIHVSRQTAMGMEVWPVERDLLSHGPNDLGFVVEIDDRGRAHLRFGDGVHGRLPPEGEDLVVTHRIGHGRVGNVGAEAISHFLPRPREAGAHFPAQAVRAVRNILAAQGGEDPQTATQIKRLAPWSFKHQARAITEADYAQVVRDEPDVQGAVATMRHTGSWTTVFVTVDRLGGLPLDESFRERIMTKLESHRLAGYDVELREPVRVPLDIAMTVCLAPGYSRSETYTRLWLELGPSRFFHPDRFTLGQPVYLSQLVATAMAVPGVRWVDLDPSRGGNRFHRFGQAPRGEHAAGRIAIGRTEVAELAADPNCLERGRLEIRLEGGR